MGRWRRTEDNGSVLVSGRIAAEEAGLVRMADNVLICRNCTVY
jgi:hypothetical protein